MVDLTLIEKVIRQGFTFDVKLIDSGNKTNWFSCWSHNYFDGEKECVLFYGLGQTLEEAMNQLGENMKAWKTTTFEEIEVLEK